MSHQLSCFINPFMFKSIVHLSTSTAYIPPKKRCFMNMKNLFVLSHSRCSCMWFSGLTYKQNSLQPMQTHDYAFHIIVTHILYTHHVDGRSNRIFRTSVWLQNVQVWEVGWKEAWPFVCRLEIIILQCYCCWYYSMVKPHMKDLL